jgi:hypothetical protein
MDEPEGNDMSDRTSEPAAVVVPEPVSRPTAAQGSELEAAIDDFMSQIDAGVVSVSRVVNPLLQVWSVARDVDAGVAVPVETLLSALVGRTLTTSTELAETMTEVRAVLASSQVLASAGAS